PRDLRRLSRAASVPRVRADGLRRAQRVLRRRLRPAVLLLPGGEPVQLLRREDGAPAEEPLAARPRLRDVPAGAVAARSHREGADQAAPDEALLLPVVPRQGLPQRLPRVSDAAVAAEPRAERRVQHRAGVAEALAGEADVPEAAPAGPADDADA